MQGVLLITRRAVRAVDTHARQAGPRRHGTAQSSFLHQVHGFLLPVYV